MWIGQDGRLMFSVFIDDADADDADDKWWLHTHNNNYRYANRTETY